MLEVYSLVRCIITISKEQMGDNLPNTVLFNKHISRCRDVRVLGVSEVVGQGCKGHLLCAEEACKLRDDSLRMADCQIMPPPPNSNEF